jgi:hypothetical protein
MPLNWLFLTSQTINSAFEPKDFQYTYSIPTTKSCQHVMTNYIDEQNSYPNVLLMLLSLKRNLALNFIDMCASSLSSHEVAS